MPWTCLHCGAYLQFFDLVSVICPSCSRRFLVRYTTTDSTKATITCTGVLALSQEVPSAFYDAFTDQELEP